MTLTCTLYSYANDVRYAIVLGGAWSHIESERRRTLFFDPCACGACGDEPPTSVLVEPAIRSAVFLGGNGLLISEMVVALRSPRGRQGLIGMYRMINESPFEIEGTITVVLGTVTADILFALAMLMMPRSSFDVGPFPAPLTSGLRVEKEGLFTVFARQLMTAPQLLTEAAAQEVQGLMFDKGLPLLVEPSPHLLASDPRRVVAP